MHHDLSRSAEPVRQLLLRTAVASGHSRRQTRTTAPLAETVLRGQSRNVGQARRLPLRIAADSVRSILRHEVKCRVAERAAAAVVGIGIGLLPVRAGSSAATQMATAEDRQGRSSTCVSPSCEARRTAEADIRGEAQARPATADLAARRATRGRVMAAVVAPVQHLAAVEATRPVEAEATSVAVAEAEAVAVVTRAVAAAAIPVVAVTPVADIQAITKLAARTLTEAK